MQQHNHQTDGNSSTNTSSSLPYYYENTGDTTTGLLNPYNSYASAPPVTSDHSFPQYDQYHHNQANYYYDYPAASNPNPQILQQQQQQQPIITYDPTSYSSYDYYDYSSSSSSSAAAAAALPFDKYHNYGVDGGHIEDPPPSYSSSTGGKVVGRSSEDHLYYSNRTGGGVMFDGYGRPIHIGGNGNDTISNNRYNGNPTSTPSPNIIVPKPAAAYQDDAHTNNNNNTSSGGAQKFRVKLLSEGGAAGQPDNTDVLCQISLDGIRILDPPTSRTLKIYPLDTVTRWEVLDSYIFAFWAETSVDAEPRRVRLKSTSYTTNIILDLVTAASIQCKEMGPSSNPADLVKGNDQSLEKKKGFIDWKTLIKPINEEKDHWVPDEAVTKCTACGTDFNAFNRKHHCRNCGDIFCDKCTQGRIALTADDQAQPVRVCDGCMAEVTQRLSNKETPAKVGGFQSHEDLARKLQEEMDKKRKKTGVNPGAARMREVECPTCTVHLQVEVGASGSQTVECSVCQHPFLVAA